MNATPASDKPSVPNLPSPIEIEKVVQRWVGQDGNGYVNLEVVAPLHPFLTCSEDILYSKDSWSYAVFALRNVPLQGEKFDWEKWVDNDETVAFWKKLNLLPENLS